MSSNRPSPHPKKEAVSCERPSACHINIKSNVDQGGVCHMQKTFKNS